MNDPVINGNMLTVFRDSLNDACAFAVINSIETFSVRAEGDGFQISFPITRDVESNLPGVLHGARARLRAAENQSPTPPSAA